MPDDRLKRLSDTVRKESPNEGLDKLISKLKPKEEEQVQDNKVSLDWRKVDVGD